MFVISKIFSIFLSPLVWIFLGLILILRIKNAKKKKYVVIIWVLFTYILTTYGILGQCLERYETPYQPLAEGKIYDYAIVLGGASGFDSFSRTLQLNQSAERIIEPVILYKKGIVKKLLISGGSANVFPPYIKDALYVRKFWMDLGVLEKDIIIESESRNTVENAKFTKEILDKRGLYKNVLLITSALHMPRSKYIFNKMGMVVDNYPVDFMVARKRLRHNYLQAYLVPSPNAIIGWQALIHEWIGLISAKW